MFASTYIRTATKWGLVPVSLLASGLLVWQSSYAAFSSTTSNPTSNWTSGTVVLSDDDSNAALFATQTNLKPGSTGTKCILVTSSGNLASTVKLYATGLTGTLGTDIDLVVSEGTPGNFSSCGAFSGSTLYSGTVAGFAGSSTGFANGVSAWAPSGSGSESKTFKFVYTVKAASTMQGATAGVAFTWEAQNV